ncbi:aminotransferase [Methylobacterium sp. E-041]|jgi:4-aminobutyrate--pyruvate transaminase|uniref:aminotransferase n=1 Tax=unclassified Methylobacterium TaxID=2615210 RepID=UPI0011CCD333|nr:MULTISPECIES: aminotransferase [unclassified Methylobacterium]MCJ2107667.1 aminotransferase [Methylobacterium sp. E-041]TXN39667.1 aminotransferase class III-fold pyridoxal phosphate-dependent enzyme [Methylobacterium sp. WL93]TXN49195.1 aminotransferase class III-fold pyridoxal phosphate-dependent enzyme [Methylobacterium sp. WL119]TXN66975.1 aminotransferase class III-fold pyridoxal phosphate-dependent enzyme [Methylobacterium sp. WL30]
MLSNLAVRDVETLIHPYTNLDAHRGAGPLVLERGEGVHVYDTEGRPYIEGMAGLWCTALGYSNGELVEAARAQMGKLPFTHLFSGRSHDPAIELAEVLKELMPVPTSKIFFTSSGSEANDTQVKLAWYLNNALGRPKKKKIIGRQRGYHGVTIATASMTGLPANHTDWDLPLPGFLHVGCPHVYRFAEPGETEAAFSQRLADELEATILREGPETVAAFVAEPVMGAGGAIVPPEGYFAAIQAVLARYDVRFIADEVICGFGRLGTWFGSEALGMRPDTLSFAKALTSGYVPLGGVSIDEPLYEAMREQSRKIGTFGHGTTYSGHPVACAVALKTIEIYKRERIVEGVAAKAPHFQARLSALAEHPIVGEARGLGLIGGLEIVADKASRRQYEPKAGVAARCVAFAQAEGLIVRFLMGDRIAVCPPLIITADEIDALFDRLTRALDRTAAWIRAEGLEAMPSL